MKKLLQKLKDYLNVRKQNQLLRQLLLGQQSAVALFDVECTRQKQEIVNVLAAITLQHGGEFVLDRASLDLATEGATLHINVDPKDKSVHYNVTFEGDTGDKNDSEPPAGYDLTDDECACCPDAETCNGGCSE